MLKLDKRCSGVLLHITSLPSAFGIGDLGPTAFKFADQLARAHQSIWQVLPIVPVGYGYSPYQSPSTFAGNPHFISPELMLEEGLLQQKEVDSAKIEDSNFVSFEDVSRNKERLFDLAYRRFTENGALREEAKRFSDRHAFWLDSYALFQTIKESQDFRPWYEWPKDLAHRNPEALARFQSEHQNRLERHKFVQFLFYRQWNSLHAHCRQNGISLLGDVPIYVAHDSADVWANRHLFYLDENGQCTVIAGVPPDYFSETGQRWGNPLYRWDKFEETDYQWWVQRLRSTLELVDGIRIDHFRGFEAYWEIPADQETAVNGRWVQGPAYSFFDSVARHLGQVPIVAEDLGLITDGVVQLIEHYGFPGMAILQFGFDSGPHAKFLPHNYEKNLVAYSGTHDNDSVLGWYYNFNSTQSAETERKARDYAEDYLALDRYAEDEKQWAFSRALYQSVANVVVLPVQDILGLGSESRMNTPGTSRGNWVWRLQRGQLTDAHIDRLAKLTFESGRGG